jgi:lysophospholipase L1-like esterase
MAQNFRLSFFGPAWPLVVVLLTSAPAAAESAPNCGAPAEFMRFDQPLSHSSQRLLSGQRLTIVAIGSSSTAGAGASSSAASYPSRLEAELNQRFAGNAFKVLNRGANGEEAADMIARFDKAVISEAPDLVLWQVGTNSVLRDGSLESADSLIRQGLQRLKASGADVVLIDPQFAPKVIAKPDADGMVKLIATAAKTVNVALFHRFAIMRHWQEKERIAFDKFLSPDGLHMNDWSYACIAKLLAGAIGEAAMRATTMAGAAAPGSATAQANSR